MFEWAGVIGMIVGFAIVVISLFVGAWVHRQDHPVPVGIFGLAMYCFGVITVIITYNLM